MRMSYGFASRTLLSVGLAAALIGGFASAAGAAPAQPGTPAAPVTSAQVQAVIQSVPAVTDTDDPHLANLVREIAALRRDIRQDRVQLRALWPTVGSAGRQAARPYLKDARAVARVAHEVAAEIRGARARLKTAKGAERLALRAELHGLRLELAALLRVKDGLLDAALHTLTANAAVSAGTVPTASSASGASS